MAAASLLLKPLMYDRAVTEQRKHLGDVSEHRVDQPQQLASVCGGLRDLHDRHSWPVGDRDGWTTGLFAASFGDLHR